MGFNDSFNMNGSLNFSDFSDEFTSFEERSSISIPVDVNQITLLSDIWIPSCLLPNRKTPSKYRETNGHINIFHTLQRRDSSQQAGSFSVYSDSEGEIFSSDSENGDLVNLDIANCKSFENEAKTLSENALAVTTVFPSGVKCRNYHEKVTEIDVCSNLKRIPSVEILCNVGLDKPLNKEKSRTDSHISLNEILDNTPEYQLNDFKHDIKIWGQEKLEFNEKKNKKKKNKKTTKVITLDEFQADYTEEDKQNDYCNEYFRKLLIQNNKADGVQLRSPADFPDLPPKELQFIHSEKSETKNVSPNMNMVAEILIKSNEVNMNKNKSIDCVEETACAVPETEITHGKFVIENIPKETEKDDIESIFSEFGEIQHLSLKPAGKFQKAHITLDFNSKTPDIDWIIECFDGENAFGPCKKPLKCYTVE